MVIFNTTRKASELCQLERVCTSNKRNNFLSSYAPVNALILDMEQSDSIQYYLM